MSSAYRSTLTITLDDGTVLTGDAAHEFAQRRAPVRVHDELHVEGTDLGFLADLAPGSVARLVIGRCDASGFAAVRNLAPGLRSLALAFADLDDSVLPHVAALTGLTYLQTFGNAFTDDGVQVLGALTALESLYLEEATLSGAAFGFVDRLPNLQRLGLQDVDLTADELAGLRAQLPDVDIG